MRLKPALGYKWVSPLLNWQSIPMGQTLKDSEQKVIDERLQYCFGHHLLKVGSLSASISTHTSVIPHQVNLHTENDTLKSGGIVGEFDEWPLLSNSIDAVLLTHLIEYCPDPHQVLREVHRVLMPNGNVIISLFNPWSMLTLHKYFPNQQYKSFKNGRFFSTSRVKDWLSLLGFEVIDESSLFYSTFFVEKSKKQRKATNEEELLADNTNNHSVDSSAFSNILKTIMPWAAGVKIITAKKREWPLTPIRPRARHKTVFSPAISNRSFNENKS